MNPRGTVMIVGVTGGVSAEAPLRVILGKRLRVMGTTLRSRTDQERDVLFARFAKDVVTRLKTGKVKSMVDKVLPMSEAQAAFTSMASNDTFGKTVLTW